MPTILSVSQDESLLVTRSEVLRRANAEVVAARANEAKRLLKERQFDLVVLCHSLTPQETDELASLAQHLTNGGHVLEVLKISELNRGLRREEAVVPQPRALVAKVIEILSLQVTQ
jgi:DNA-binding response OmpR family regulator